MLWVEYTKYASVGLCVLLSRPDIVTDTSGCDAIYKGSDFSTLMHHYYSSAIEVAKLENFGTQPRTRPRLANFGPGWTQQI